MEKPSARVATEKKGTTLSLDFASFMDSGGRGDASWLQEVRRNAYARFSERGLPTRKDEQWKYTNVRPITDANPVLATTADSAPDGELLEDTTIDGAIRVVIANGQFMEESSVLSSLPDGLSIRAFKHALDEDADDLRQKLEETDQPEHPFSLLNLAFMTDGLYLTVAPGAVIDRPIQLIVVGGSPDSSVSFPRIMLQLGEGSQLTFVESHRSLSHTAPHLCAPVADIALARGAKLHHAKVMEGDAESFHVSMNRVTLQRDATYQSIVCALDGRLSRNNIHVTLGGEGAHADLFGLYALDNKQHVDNHTFMEHAAPNTTSREHYKGILSGSSRGIFFGRILVCPDAQKINAEQTNNNLLLSDEAQADSTPQLEIYADDVQCRHGSTIGQLDNDALFYLQARGIPKKEARELLSFAFSQEIVDHIEIDTLRERISSRLLSDRDVGGNGK